MTMNELIPLIEQWGRDKGILPEPDPYKQFFKTQEEVDELYAAICTTNSHEAKDAIGDIIVTLIMQCGAWGFTLDECVEQAYKVISKRTGKMVDGVFVKDE